MNSISQIMLHISILFFCLGSYIFYIDKNSTLNRVFFAMNFSLAIWSLADAFLNASAVKEGCLFWGKIGAFGYCTFTCISLHFFLLYTKKNYLFKKIWIYFVLYGPPAIFLYKALTGDLFIKDFFRSSNGFWVVVRNTTSLWYWLLMAHYLIYGIAGVLIAYYWIRKTTTTREQKQARILFVSALMTFILCSIFNILPSLLNLELPDFTPIGSIVWSIGILYGVVKYKFMMLTPSLAAENILQTILDSVILINPEGQIISVNQETTRLLEFDHTELIGKPISSLFLENQSFKGTHFVRLFDNGSIRNMENFFITKTGEKIPVILSISECKDNYGNIIGFAVVSRDIAKLKNTETLLSHLAHHDTLTDLPNRLLFNNRLEHSIIKAHRNNTFLAVILLDLDRFKEINDAYGHNKGDMLLIAVAQRLKESIRASDTIARLGGDEFVILIDDMREHNDYIILIDKIIKNLSAPYLIEEQEIRSTASFGIAVYPIDGNNKDSLLQSADLAMYHAKSLGKNNYQLYTSSMSAALTEKISLENDLLKAFENNELLLHYQPIIDVQSGIIIAIEALVRWNHPVFGILSPDKFISLAEDRGLIDYLDEWVLRNACEQARIWQKRGLARVNISVNFSAQQFMKKDLSKKILQILKEIEFDSEYLMVEITENTVINDIENAMVILKELKENNIKVAIDDFGKGYSSLHYLQKLPIYAIKIDKLFVEDLPLDTGATAIIAAIVLMAKSMNVNVIVEGIERAEQLEAMKSYKWELTDPVVCKEAQGYLFSRPVPSEQITVMLQKQKNGERFIHGSPQSH